MGRQKNQSSEAMAKAASEFEPILKKYRTLKDADREKLLQGLFLKIFKDRITEARYNYGKERIRQLFTPVSRQPSPPDSSILSAFEKESLYLKKNKLKTPSYFLSLVSLSLIGELIKRSSQFKDKDRLLKVVQSFHDLSEIGPEDFSDLEVNKKIPLEVIEHILKRAEYDLSLKVLIYRSEQKRLKHSFNTYCLMAVNEWPYYFLNRIQDADTLFQYLYHFNSLKLNVGLDKKAAYPPKRIVVLERIQYLRKNSDSPGKIYTEIQAILDPDHSSNHSIST